jgi:hypothetical protein
MRIGLAWRDARRACYLIKNGIEVDAFYWTVPAPDIVNSGREERGSVSV